MPQDSKKKKKQKQADISFIGFLQSIYIPETRHPRSSKHHHKSKTVSGRASTVKAINTPTVAAGGQGQSQGWEHSKQDNWGPAAADTSQTWVSTMGEARASKEQEWGGAEEASKNEPDQWTRPMSGEGTSQAGHEAGWQASDGDSRGASNEQSWTWSEQTSRVSPKEQAWTNPEKSSESTSNLDWGTGQTSRDMSNDAWWSGPNEDSGQAASGDGWPVSEGSPKEDHWTTGDDTVNQASNDGDWGGWGGSGDGQTGTPNEGDRTTGDNTFNQSSTAADWWTSGEPQTSTHRKDDWGTGENAANKTSTDADWRTSGESQKSAPNKQDWSTWGANLSGSSTEAWPPNEAPVKVESSSATWQQDPQQQESSTQHVVQPILERTPRPYGSSTINESSRRERSLREHMPSAAVRDPREKQSSQIRESSRAGRSSRGESYMEDRSFTLPRRPFRKEERFSPNEEARYPLPCRSSRQEEQSATRANSRSSLPRRFSSREERSSPRGEGRSPLPHRSSRQDTIPLREESHVRTHRSEHRGDRSQRSSSRRQPREERVRANLSDQGRYEEDTFVHSPGREQRWTSNSHGHNDVDEHRFNERGSRGARGSVEKEEEIYLSADQREIILELNERYERNRYEIIASQFGYRTGIEIGEDAVREVLYDYAFEDGYGDDYQDYYEDERRRTTRRRTRD